MTDISESGLHRALRDLSGDGEDMPRSVLWKIIVWIGGLLQLVVIALLTWLISGQQTTTSGMMDLKGDVREINVKINSSNEKLGDLKATQSAMDLRLSNMEQRQIQAIR